MNEYENREPVTDPAEEIRGNGKRTAGAQGERRSVRSRIVGTARLFLTGEILVRDEVAKFYNYVFYIALMFLLSIVTLFAALQLDTRCSKLEDEVQLLHERSIRIKEQRFHQCSHSAIIERLEQHGIELYDPLSPSNVIK